MSEARKPRIPTATYRLQLHRDFTFRDAAAIVPYLHALGVSHCYVSPYLKARAGSRHGYDIVDHQSLNPELGNAEDYAEFMRVLHEHGMGQVLDIVPNHMGVGGDDNQWWMDVLENGPASAYADYFDIDWRPPKEDLRGKLLSPVLGEHYGKSLENGDIRLVFEAEQGTFAVRYYAHRLPIDPRTYPMILQHDLARLEETLGPENPLTAEFASLITALRNLPSRGEASEQRRKERRRDKEVHKRRLARLAAEHPDIRRFIEDNVACFNGAGANGDRFGLLHELLETQAFRLAFWRAASDEINYRRFFDINDLAGLRTENPEVFEATHRLVLEMIRRGDVDGLRIDHPDGLYDPARYYEQLQCHIKKLSGGAPSQSGNPALYVVAEKILAGHEHLPENWQVHGTTGYDYANLVNGVFVYGAAERELDRVYRRFTRSYRSVDEQLYESKKIVMRAVLSSELHVLANYLDRISESDRYTRDFTRSAQLAALFEVVAWFPVYRTYVTGAGITETDRRYVDWAIAAAKRNSTAADASIFDFIRRILLLEDMEQRDENYRRAAVEFVMRFQQFTAPVMAKGLEDTLFYRYNRLTSLNEVGADPRRFAVSTAAFHHANQERLRRWPHTMLCTSSHDTKRSEDVRARLNVLSEIPGEWRKCLARWSRLNRAKKRRLGEEWTPSANDEYLFYQTLLGIWPLTPPDEASLASLRERLEAYMLKAIREAKLHTSWINPNTEYEAGVTSFVRSLLTPRQRDLFLEDFLGFQGWIGRLGMMNGLSQTLLKLTSPGVPDIYQGTETWDFSLVDPDNRRPVDYVARARALQEISAFPAENREKRLQWLRSLLTRLEDGGAKLFIIWRLLGLRRRHPDCFSKGEYLPLNAEGPLAEHLCGFARVHDEQILITASPRWFSRLMKETERWPAAATWNDTWLEAPPGPVGREYLNWFTGETVVTRLRHDKNFLPASSLFAHFPLAAVIYNLS